jgi:uncharacterized protein YdeI (YjbR/CyaY-like superfamily)
MGDVTDNQLDIPDAGAWRDWLAAHHASETEVWLVYRKGGGVSYGESVDEALCYGWIDGLVRSIDETRYARRFTPRRPGSKWSASNKQRVDRLLGEGRMAQPGRVVIERAKADRSWDLIPDAERKWSMPAELQHALETNSVAREAFESSSTSHQHQFVMWVASAKRPETRERRAARAVEMLFAGERPT